MDSKETIEKRLRLLLVEDSPIIRQALQAMLTDDGIYQEIVTAESEHSAKAILAQRTQPFDAAIVDVRLAQGSGLEVIRALRASPVSREAYVIVLTNYVIGAFKDAAQQAGADVFLDKSKDFSRVALLIRQRFALR